MRNRIRITVPLIVLALGALVPAPVAAAEPVGFEYFHTYDENTALIDQAVTDHPAIARRFSIGQSFEGRTIWGIKISDNPAVDENEPEIFLHGLTHARERASNEMALYVIEMLTNEYASDARIRDIVDGREIWIVPMLNPDGAEFDFSDGVFHRWRKNRQTIPGSASIGIDLNRNWPFKWACCGSGKANPASDNYRGWGPAVAPEVQAYMDFVDGRVVNGRQQIRVSIGFHSAGRQVLWPYSWTKTDVPKELSRDDWLAMVALGQQMAAFNSYTPEQGSDLYIVDGDQGDWEYSRHRIFAYTFEMAAGSQRRYYPNQPELANDLARNRGAVLLILEMADCPFRAAGLETTNCGPLYDDFEAGRGWEINPFGTDTATKGRWARAVPLRTSNAAGVKQLAATMSGMQALVTGPSGGGANRNDIDGGMTSVRSPEFTLGAASTTGWRLEFSYSFAHGPSATAADFLRVRVGGDVVFEQLAAPSDRQGAWTTVSVDLDTYAGETVRVLIEAADSGADGLVEAAIDDVRVYRQP